MNKFLFVLFIFGATIIIASCDYDDSNDIDILKPTDSTSTAISVLELPN